MNGVWAAVFAKVYFFRTMTKEIDDYQAGSSVRGDAEQHA
jgi:hypothetical protein